MAVKRRGQDLPADGGRSDSDAVRIGLTAPLPQRLQRRLGPQRLRRPVQLWVDIAQPPRRPAERAREQPAGPLLRGEQAVAAVAAENLVGAVAGERELDLLDASSETQGADRVAREGCRGAASGRSDESSERRSASVVGGEKLRIWASRASRHDRPRRADREVSTAPGRLRMNATRRLSTPPERRRQGHVGDHPRAHSESSARPFLSSPSAAADGVGKSKSPIHRPGTGGRGGLR